MKEKTKAYMAGLMDAEGCIRLAPQETASGTFYSPRVMMSNQSRRAMKWSVLHFGGSFARNKNRNAGRDWFIWYLCSRKSTHSFLALLLPYLKLKKAQAELLMNFCSEYEGLTEEQKAACYQGLVEAKLNGSVTTDTHNDYRKADQAYLAGFFDGEGCIRINRIPQRHTISYHLVLSITNINQAILKLHQSLYGGLLRHKGLGVYDWILSGKPLIEKFLLHALPYLVIKREEALLGLEYIRMGRTVCPEERERLYNALKLAKQSKIQSDLVGDYESAPPGTATAQTNVTNDSPSPI